MSSKATPKPDNPPSPLRFQFLTIRDETSTDEETREFCVAHVKRGVAGHYRSTTATAKRRVVLQAWADYIATGIVPEHLQPPKSLM